MTRLATRLLLTTTLISPTMLAAQSETALELEPIVLFAGLLPTAPETTGATIDILGAETLKAEGLSAPDALKTLPGVTVSQNGGLGTSATVRIRGLGGAYIGVRVDGIDVTDPASTQTTFNFGTLMTGSLSRVSVIKGSQSAIFGSNAIAGGIDIETWRPEVEGTSGQVNLEAGSYGTYGGNLSVGYLDDRAEIALSLGRVVSDGFSAQDFNDEDDGFEQTYANFFAGYQVTDDLRLGVSALWSDGTTEFDRFDPDDSGEFEEERRGYRAFAEYQWGAWTHELSFSQFQSDRYDAEGFTQSFVGERDTLSYLASGEISPVWALALGADWTEERANLDGDKYDASNSAVFGEARYTPNEDLELSLTMRYDEYSDFDSQFSGRAALSYQVAQNTLLRTSFGTGYRAPSLYERFGPFAGGELSPEESRSFDVGIEQNLNGRGVLRATYFWSEIDDLIAFAVSDSCSADQAFGCYTQVDGTTGINGLELSGEYDITDRITLAGAYTYTEAETDGERLIRVPKHDLTLAMQAAVTDELRLGVQVTHVADTLDGFGDPTALDDYTVWDLSVRYDVTDTTTVYAAIDNATDQDYQTVRGFNTPDRTYRFGLEAKF